MQDYSSSSTDTIKNLRGNEAAQASRRDEGADKKPTNVHGFAFCCIILQFLTAEYRGCQADDLEGPTHWPGEF